MLIGALLILFALADENRFSFKNSSVVLFSAGGLVSGFFCGLSGHQGAIRSWFLSKSNEKPAVFVATGALIALGVDLVRIAGYQSAGLLQSAQAEWQILAAAGFFAVSGAVLGNLYLKKVSLQGIRLFIKWGIIGLGILSISNGITSLA